VVPSIDGARELVMIGGNSSTVSPPAVDTVATDTNVR
jgi:hypothetical protein